VTRFVLDAPALLRVVSDEVVVSEEHRLVAPHLVRSQALALLFAAVRSGELDESEALRRHTRLTETKIRLLGDRVSRGTAWKIAREQGWETTYDAEYVAVTRLQADALVALDPSLREKADGLVPLAQIDDLRGSTVF
jgi:predicted nucleic acid-binding protein